MFSVCDLCQGQGCPTCKASGAVLQAPAPPMTTTDEQPYPPSDPLGRVYTPARLCFAMLRCLASRAPAPPKVVLEPSVGGGAFIPAIRASFPDSKLLGVDIDPLSKGLAMLRGGHPPMTQLGDFVTIARHWDRMPLGQFHGRPDLIVGNPPFGKSVGLAVTIEHIVAAIELAVTGAMFVLPLPYLCGLEFDTVWKIRRPAVVWRVVGRPWPERLRECAVFEWNKTETWRHTILADLPEWP